MHYRQATAQASTSERLQILNRDGRPFLEQEFLWRRTPPLVALSRSVQCDQLQFRSTSLSAGFEENHRVAVLELLKESKLRTFEEAQRDKGGSCRPRKAFGATGQEEI